MEVDKIWLVTLELEGKRFSYSVLPSKDYYLCLASIDYNWLIVFDDSEQIDSRAYLGELAGDSSISFVLDFLFLATFPLGEFLQLGFLGEDYST